MVDSRLRTVGRSSSVGAVHSRQSGDQRVNQSPPGLMTVGSWMPFDDQDSNEPRCEFPRAVKPGLPASSPQCVVGISPIVNAYMNEGAPFGIAKMLAGEQADIMKRIFVLDNSGSTSKPDGHVLRKERVKDGYTYHSQDSTRWEEICTTAIDQAEWNARAGVQCEFVLLNSPSSNSPVKGRDYVVIDPALGNVDGQLHTLHQLLRQNGPRGPTPLTARLTQLGQRLLREQIKGRRIMLSIITDGLPSPTGDTCTQQDKMAFMLELRAFTGTFNSFVVIRLATDDDATVEYFNAIDGELELPLDILDDLKGEAIEVHQSGNGWFAYTPMIHRIREGGTMEKMFDLLDERPFTTVEIASFLELLLLGPEDTPFPRQPKELYERVQETLQRAPHVYNGRLGRMTPPVDIKLLKQALGRTRWGQAKQLLRRASSLVSLRR